MVFRFADDYLVLTQGSDMCHPIIILVLLFRAVGVPLKWSKFRGGFEVCWIGYFFDFVGFWAGVSDSRCDWAAVWCSRVATGGRVQVRSFREGLGRLAFAAELLVFAKPFLGPLYAWSSVLPDGAVAEVPVMVQMVLKWLEEKFGERRRIQFGKPQVHVGEKFRADAKAKGDSIVIGGWEVGGHEGVRAARWFSLRLDKSQIPWAYARGEPFRSVSALE